MIIMDVNLYDISANEARSKLKNICFEIPVIAQTGIAFYNDDEKAEQAGFAGNISKPIDKLELFNLISTFF